MISVNMVAGIRKVVHMSVQRTSIHVTLSMTTATDVQQPTGEVLSLRMLTTQAQSRFRFALYDVDNSWSVMTIVYSFLVTEETWGAQSWAKSVRTFAQFAPSHCVDRILSSQIRFNNKYDRKRPCISNIDAFYCINDSIFKCCHLCNKTHYNRWILPGETSCYKTKPDVANYVAA